MCLTVIIKMVQLNEVLFKRVLGLANELEATGKFLAAARLVSGLSKITDQEAFVRGYGKDLSLLVRRLRRQLFELSRMSESDMYLSAGLNPPNLAREKPRDVYEKVA